MSHRIGGAYLARQLAEIEPVNPAAVQEPLPERPASVPRYPITEMLDAASLTALAWAKGEVGLDLYQAVAAAGRMKLTT